MKRTKKSLLTILLACIVALSLAACGQEKKDPGPDYADDEAMEIIAEGFEARQDAIVEVAEKEPLDTESMKNLRTYVEAELGKTEKLKTRVFEDSEMQEYVLSYINALNDSLKCLENNPVNSAEFYDEWQKIADTRASIMKVFVDEYGLTVDEKYQDDLNEVLATGAAASNKSKIQDAIESLVASITFEKTDDGYGMFTYTGVAENTTGIDFENVGIVLRLYDADGIKLEDCYMHTSSWKAGEKVRFETPATSDAAETRVSIDCYTVAE